MINRLTSLTNGRSLMMTKWQKLAGFSLLMICLTSCSCSDNRKPEADKKASDINRSTDEQLRS